MAAEENDQDSGEEPEVDKVKQIKAASRDVVLAAKLRPVRKPRNKKAYRRNPKHRGRQD